MTSFSFATQLVESKATSLNQVTASFKTMSFKPGVMNLDYGGGKYDKASAMLAALGARNIVYDPFNRSLAHNLSARLTVARYGGADTVTVNNVLNVIAEPEAIAQVIAQAANGLRSGGEARFLIHEGDGTGAGRQSSKGWQRHEKASAFIGAVGASFGMVSRKGNMLIASEPQHTVHSLFDLNSLASEIMFESKRLGTPQPDSRRGVGKLIGGRLYLHKSAWDALPQAELATALSRLPALFAPDIAKWDAKTGCFSFIACAGFDTQDEPSIQGAIKVFPDGTTSVTSERAAPHIYHHKWNLTRPSYEGFDYLSSVIRSISWATIACDRSRIGMRSVWESEVLWPALAGSGAQLPDPRTPGEAAQKIKNKR